MNDQEIEARIAEIKERHAAIVPAGMIFAVSEGWLGLIDDGLGKIEKYLRDVGWIDRAEVRQIKEKFGELRIYVRPKEGHEWSDEVATGLAVIRDEITRTSARTCEVCGRPGEIVVVDHYHQCLCSDHHAKRLKWVSDGRPDVDWR